MSFSHIKVIFIIDAIFINIAIIRSGKSNPAGGFDLQIQYRQENRGQRRMALQETDLPYVEDLVHRYRPTSASSHNRRAVSCRTLRVTIGACLPVLHLV